MTTDFQVITNRVNISFCPLELKTASASLHLEAFLEQFYHRLELFLILRSPSLVSMGVAVFVVSPLPLNPFDLSTITKLQTAVG